MNWFRRTPRVAESRPDHGEADRALAKTRRETAEAMKEWPRVEYANRILTEQLKRDDFAESLRLAMGGK